MLETKPEKTYEVEKYYFVGHAFPEPISGGGSEAMVRAVDYENLLDAFLNNAGLDDLQVLEAITAASARRVVERLKLATSNLPATYLVYALKVFIQEFQKGASGDAAPLHKEHS
jgi:hypothetical protein